MPYHCIENGALALSTRASTHFPPKNACSIRKRAPLHGADRIRTPVSFRELNLAPADINVILICKVEKGRSDLRPAPIPTRRKYDS